MTSKAQLEAWLGCPVRWFAYPRGKGDRTTRALVREAGFDAACAMVPGLVTANADPFWLPRLFVENWDGERLEAKIAEMREA